MTKADDYVKKINVINEIKNAFTMCDCHCDEHALIERVNVMEAEDVKPIRHGAWKIQGIVVDQEYGGCVNLYKCTNCGYETEYDSKYCPRCGSRMDGRK